MNLRIELSPNPTEEERQAILQPLRAYNASKAAGAVPEHIALLVRDDNDEILGGLYARLFYQWLFIDLLSVPEQARGQGMGTRLMQMAEDLAQAREMVREAVDIYNLERPHHALKYRTPDAVHRGF